MDENGSMQQNHTTVLVVDDEYEILGLIRTMLERAGYEVLEAGNAEAALQISAAHNNTIHLLLTDIIMPGMNGFHLADKLKADRPGLKVLFMTGYLDNVISQQTGIMTERVPCIRKPFKQHTLTQKIEAVLGTPPSTVAFGELSSNRL